jgi:NAD(P)H-dependent FMN reductase
MSKVMVIIGSARKGRSADKVYDAALYELNVSHEIPHEDIDTVDPLGMVIPYFNEATPPAYADGKFDSTFGVMWEERLRDAERILILTPEYNYNMPAVLKSLIDWGYKGWLDKPLAIASWGVSGGSDAQVSLRQTFTKMGANLLPMKAQIKLDQLDDEEFVRTEVGMLVRQLLE